MNERSFIVKFPVWLIRMGAKRAPPDLQSGRQQLLFIDRQHGRFHAFTPHGVIPSSATAGRGTSLNAVGFDLNCVIPEAIAGSFSRDCGIKRHPD